jgi:hypothetical protein
MLGLLKVLTMWLWPWVKESLFANKTFQTWLRQNIALVCWIVLWVMALIGLMITLGINGTILTDNTHWHDLYQKQQTQQQQQAKDLTRVTQENTELKQTEADLKDELYWSRGQILGLPSASSVPDPIVMPRLPPIKDKTGKHRSRPQDLIEVLDQWDARHRAATASSGASP